MLIVILDCQSIWNLSFICHFVSKNKSSLIICLLDIIFNIGIYCYRQEEPVILISRLLLRMHSLYLASFVRMNGMYRTQSDHVRFYLLSLIICSCMFWPSITSNLHKARLWSKTFDRCRRHFVHPLVITSWYFRYSNMW